jgi:lipopolysaccharide transport system ATP-binding protein
MYVRLAFSVAAHLEPEILLVDEVLAVGDAQFQKKCLGKMDDVAKGGRTILFVSHNTAAIESLCSRVLLLERGRVELFGETRDVVSSYLARNWQQETNPLSTNSRTGNGKVRVVSFHMESPDGTILQSARSGEPVVLVFGFENHGCDIRDRISLSFGVHTDRELALFHYYSHFSNIFFENLAQAGCFKCLIPELPLAPGNYLLQCRAVMNGDQNTGEEVDWPRVFIPITVAVGDFYRIGNYNLSTWAPILVKGTWSIVGGRFVQ